ncbi:Purine-binding protein [Neomoorella glycerini]|uniref:Purine-binding protein n=1 Tax=Neomoorella glycerini TaxID=55779 RepID=A0A6I5ZRB0_9FIRM|nr:BMP family protein [Moorella glycerini]QGP92276.1 Purine-binding protein [Moorella glycerini]
MVKFIKNLLLLILIAILATGLTACGGSKASDNKSAGGGQTRQSEGNQQVQKTFKVAMLLPGSASDGGWSTSAYEGLMKIQKDLGAEVAFTENVKKNDQVQIMREYARKGFDVVIGHGFEFSDALKQVAQEYPNVKFAGVGTNVTGPNLASLQFKYGELGYLVGIVAAKATKSNKIGIVTATKDPTGQIEFDNLEEEAKKLNPNVSVTIAYTGSWEDINKAKEAALAQIASGVDVIVTNCDAGNLGVVQAAKEKNIMVIGWTGDYYDQAPDNVLTSAVQKVSLLIFTAVKEFKEGQFKGQVYQLGLKDKVQYIGKYGNKVPKEVQDEVAKAAQDVIDGKIQLKGKL